MDFLILCVFIVIIGMIIMNFIVSKQKKAMNKYLDKLENFSATQKVTGADGNSILAIDEKRNKICLIERTQKDINIYVFSYKDLLSSEIFEDGITITKTVRSSQLGGALLGSLAFGSIGAVIGELSGKTRTLDKVKKVDLRLTINDTHDPIHDISFLNLETKKDSALYKQAIQKARYWHGLLEVLIKRADAEDKANESVTTINTNTVSIADELKKLAELREAGILTADEF